MSTSTLQYFVLLSVVVSALFSTGSGYSAYRKRASPYAPHEYAITKTWDNQTTPDNAVITVSFQVVDEFYPSGRGLVVTFDAPYYNSPLISDTVPVDRPFLGLWNYEVVEAFFLGNDEEYLEIELGPKGHYVLLLLKGPNNLITYQLPLTNYTAHCNTVSGRWLGQAYIPGEYFPCNVTRFNSFAIHNQEPNRVHMALFPVAQGAYEAPDFHRLDAFQPISMGVELNPKCSISSVSATAVAVPCCGGAVAVPVRPHHDVTGPLPVEKVPEVVWDIN